MYHYSAMQLYQLTVCERAGNTYLSSLKISMRALLCHVNVVENENLICVLTVLNDGQDTVSILKSVGSWCGSIRQAVPQ